MLFPRHVASWLASPLQLELTVTVDLAKRLVLCSGVQWCVSRVKKGEARVLGCALVFKVVVLEGLLRQPSVWPAVVQRGVQPQPLPLLYQLLGMRGLNSKQ